MVLTSRVTLVWREKKLPLSTSRELVCHLGCCQWKISFQNIGSLVYSYMLGVWSYEKSWTCVSPMCLSTYLFSWTSVSITWDAAKGDAEARYVANVNRSLQRSDWKQSTVKSNANNQIRCYPQNPHLAKRKTHWHKAEISCSFQASADCAWKREGDSPCVRVVASSSASLSTPPVEVRVNQALVSTLTRHSGSLPLPAPCKCTAGWSSSTWPVNSHLEN